MDELKVRFKLRSQLVCAHQLHSQSWDCRYGQTPEFTYTFSQRFEWGETVGVKTCVGVRFVYTAVQFLDSRNYVEAWLDLVVQVGQHGS